MTRFMAIHSVPDMTEEKFQEALGEVKHWRPDRRTTIVKGIIYVSTKTP